MSRFFAAGQGAVMLDFSKLSESGPKLECRGEARSESALGLAFAHLDRQVPPDQKEHAMARSITNKQPRKRPSTRRYVEERPVLQLPLEAPVWREPPSREPERAKPERAKPESDRGIAVIDFFI